MKLVRAVQDRPFLLLGVAVVGFGSWLVFHAIGESESISSAGADVIPGQWPRPLPLPPDVNRLTITAPLAPPRPGVITAEMVPHLRPGMARVDVEGLVGPPPAAMVQPVKNVDGRFTYRADYLANLEPTAPPHVGAPQLPVPRSVISLEFDASRPGHPLLKIHIADPMS